MKKDKPRIAIVTFTDDRDAGIADESVENLLRKKQSEIKSFLERNSIDVIDPLPEIKKDKNNFWYGLRKITEVNEAASILNNKYEVDGVIIGAWTWSPPMLAMQFIRKVNKPIMYYSENNPMGGGLSQFSAACSSLLEWGVNEHALKHERNFGSKDEIISWVNGITAASRLRESAILLWGGTYAVKMEQLQDDVPKLKSFLIRDILSEDQYILINRAEKIIKNHPERIKSFIEWTKNKGMTVINDSKMFTEESFNKQTALLIAARDRLQELRDEDISGVSIKCQPEIYSEYGVNACTLPAFLPFPVNEDGMQKVYPTVCEGDIKGLLSSLILFYINPLVPPAFGDLVSVEDDYIEFANCGGGSIFWAANSSDPDKALKNVTAQANIHGVTGASFNYFGKEHDKVTILRLTRIKGKYYAQLGIGKALNARPFLSKKFGKDLESHLGQRWGKVVVDLGVKAQNFVKIVGANHLSATMGDYSREIEYFCRQVNIEIVRIDNDSEILNFYNSIRNSN
ncbi:MAG: hypothetical protein ACYCXK_03280 [Candidatus Humimicrobiaceae bacterium]